MQQHSIFPALAGYIAGKDFESAIQAAQKIQAETPFWAVSAFLEAAEGKNWENIALPKQFAGFDYMSVAREWAVLFICLAQAEWDKPFLDEYRKAMVQYFSDLSGFIREQMQAGTLAKPAITAAIALRDWIQVLVNLLDELGILGSKANLAFIKTQITLSVLPEARHEIAPDMVQAAKTYEAVQMPEQAIAFFKGVLMDFEFLLDPSYQQWCDALPPAQYFVQLYALGEAYSGLLRLQTESDQHPDFNTKLQLVEQKIELLRAKAQVEVAVAVFLENPKLEWEAVYEKIVEATGGSAQLGLDLYRFIPIAYCRQLLPEVQYADHFLTIDSDGEYTVQNFFAENALYQLVWAYAQKPLEGELMHILKHSADLNLINQALYEGTRLETVVLAAPVFL